MRESIEIAKRRYSQELAAYTYQQWRLARSAWEAAQASAAAASVESPTGSDDTTSSFGSRSDERRRSQATEAQVEQHRERERNLHAIDFAHKTPLVNGTA